MFAVQEKFFLRSEPKDIMKEFILLLQKVRKENIRKLEVKYNPQIINKSNF